MYGLENIVTYISFLIVLLGPVPLSLFLASYIVRKIKDNYIPNIILFFFTIWIVISTLIGLSLGALSLLSYYPIYISESVLFATGIILIRLNPDNLNKLIEKTRSININFNIYSILFIIFITIFLGYNLLQISLIPIDEADSVWYHLPIISNWFQSGSFDTVDYLHQNRYPFNWQVLCALFVFPFGYDFYVSLPMIFILIVYYLATYLLCMKIGASKLYSALLSTLALLYPVISVNIHSMRTDIPLATFVTLTLYLLLVTKQYSDISLKLLLVTTMSMLIAIKVTGIIYGITIIIFYFVVRIYGNIHNNLYDEARVKTRINYKYIISIIFIILFLGCFWYINNYIEVGNPLGNVEYKLFGTTIFEGSIKYEDIDSTRLAHIFNISDINHWDVLVIEGWSQLGTPFIILLIIVFFYPLLFAEKHNTKIYRHNYLGAVVIIMLIFLVIYWNTPYSATGRGDPRQLKFLGYNMRYALPFLNMLAVSASVIATRLEINSKLLIMSIIMGSIGILNGLIAIYAVALSLVVVFILYFMDKYRFPHNTICKYRKCYIILTIVLIISIGYIVTSANESKKQARLMMYGGILKYIEDNIAKEETIGFVGSQRTYFLYGEYLNRRVVSLELDGRPYLINDVDKWLSDIYSDNIRTIAVGPYGRYSRGRIILFGWLEFNEKRFKRIFGTNPYKHILLYRIINKDGDDSNIIKLDNVPGETTTISRRIAIKLLGDIQDDWVLDNLYQALSDDNKEIRRISKKALINKGAKAVDILQEAIDDKNIIVRSAAISILGEIDDERTVILLGKMLKDREVTIRRMATSILGEKKNQSASMPLIEALGDGDVEVRRIAVRALGDIRGDQVVEALSDSLKDDDVAVRRGALESLRMISTPSVEILGELLKDNDVKIQRSARDYLLEFGVSAIDTFAEALTDNDARVRMLAASALSEIQDARAVDPLIAALDDSEKSVRRVAVKSLGGIGGSQVMEALSRLITDDDRVARRIARESLVEIGVPAIRTLGELLLDDDVKLRRNAASILAEIRDESSIGLLSGALEDTDVNIRRIAVNALGEIGGAKVVDYLSQALTDNDTQVRQTAKAFLAKIGLPALASLGEALTHSDKRIRRIAVSILLEIKGERAVGLLRDALRDTDVNIRRVAVKALGEIDGAQVVAALSESLGDDDRLVRQEAQESLIKIGVPAIETLGELLNAEDLRLRRTAIIILSEINDVRAAGPLIAALKDSDAKIRHIAATALGDIGDTKAVGPLQEALMDKNKYVRRKAREALSKLRKY